MPRQRGATRCLRASAVTVHFLAALSRSRDISAWVGMFNDRLQLASPRKREVSRKRYDADVIVNHVVYAGCSWRIAFSIALTTVGRADAQSLAGRDEGAPVPSQRHVDAEAAERSPDGSSEAGRRAELVLYCDEHDDAVVAEDTRLGTVQVCPVANVTDLVVAQPAG